MIEGFGRTSGTFRLAVSAIDAGDSNGLDRLLADNPELVRERADCGEGYFHRPYLLWFVAENPVRCGRLPRNIGEIAGLIIRAAEREGADSLRHQLDYALALASSGRVARESGVQRELIDILADAGANPEAGMLPALAHRELEAVERLLDRGARLTLPVALCTGRLEDSLRLASEASAEDKRIALASAALYGQADSLRLALGFGGVDLNAYSPPGFHPHATAFHHAVASGSLDAVKVLAEAGADRRVKDTIYHGTPLDWAKHLQFGEIAAYLGDRAEQGLEG